MTHSGGTGLRLHQSSFTFSRSMNTALLFILLSESPSIKVGLSCVSLLMLHTVVEWWKSGFRETSRYRYCSIRERTQSHRIGWTRIGPRNECSWGLGGASWSMIDLSTIVLHYENWCYLEIQKGVSFVDDRYADTLTSIATKDTFLAVLHSAANDKPFEDRDEHSDLVQWDENRVLYLS